MRNRAKTAIRPDSSMKLLCRIYIIIAGGTWQWTQSGLELGLSQSRLAAFPLLSLQNEGISGPNALAGYLSRGGD
jgi:hypothetical protein